MLLFLLFVVIIAGIAIKKNRDYKKSTYYQVTQNPLLSVCFDKGRLGEYMTYKNLRNWEKSGAKFLFNLYIPKGENETTEIDVLMITPKGLFVFESKNYSGWIFGSEYQRNWYQTLPQGRGRSHKESFYNPIMQNRTHIQHLQILVGENIPMYSVIIFSDRCTLKKVEVKSQDIHVINRYDVMDTVASVCNRIQNVVLSERQITEIFDKLYPYTQVDSAVRVQHIANIQNKLNPIPTEPEAGKQTDKNATAEDHSGSVQSKVLICPKCGGTLILRTAARGPKAGNRFYGCSNYPKCRYVQELIKEEKTDEKSENHSPA